MVLALLLLGSRMLPSGTRVPAAALTVLCLVADLRAEASRSTSPVDREDPPADALPLWVSLMGPSPSPGRWAPVMLVVSSCMGWVVPGSTSPVDSLEPPFIACWMGLVALISAAGVVGVVYQPTNQPPGRALLARSDSLLTGALSAGLTVSPAQSLLARRPGSGAASESTNVLPRPRPSLEQSRAPSKPNNQN